MRAVLSKAAYDEVHKASSGERFYTIDKLLEPITSAINSATQQLRNINPNYEESVERALKELCAKVEMPFEQIKIFMTRHFREVAKHFHLFVNTFAVRQTLIATLKPLLLGMAQVVQGSKTVGEAAMRILQAYFPSLANVHSTALYTWEVALKNSVDSLKSEL